VCIPLNALHEDANQRSFVYVVSERAGILGTELTAEMVYVRVLDRNDSFAAVEEGVIDRETEVIVSSTEELEDRAVIRYKE
jgi:multidrug efflux pump subunit AcrA (membrane-fusion protein)